MGGEELKRCQLAHHQLMSQPGPHFSPYRKAKTNEKSTNMVSSGISDVMFASVYSEKTRLKKCWIMIIFIMKKSQETTVFGGLQKLSSAMKLRPEK